MSYRIASSGSAVAQVKSTEVAAAHPATVFTASLFSGWVTCIQFIADVGLHGVVAAASNDGNVVLYDPDSRGVMLRMEGHALAGKDSQKSAKWSFYIVNLRGS